jgi:hypothetical protein
VAALVALVQAVATGQEEPEAAEHQARPALEFRDQAEVEHAGPVRSRPALE